MIRRAPKRGYLGGVCQGMAEATDTSAIAWRILAIFVPGSLWAYLILWILLKAEDQWK